MLQVIFVTGAVPSGGSPRLRSAEGLLTSSLPEHALPAIAAYVSG